MKNLIPILTLIGIFQVVTASGCKKSSMSEISVPPLKVYSVYSWLVRMQQPNGLLLSTEGGRLVSLYDNALAAIAFTAYGDLDKAEKIFDFYNSRLESELLQKPGGFGQMRTSDGIPVDNKPRRWLGDNAWFLIALNNYHHIAQNRKYQSLETALSNWIISLQDADGGLWGGFAENGSRISKIAEGNIDAFNAIPGYTSFHQKLLGYFKNTRWDETDKLIISWAENPKYKYALDVLAWSYCSFEDLPAVVLSKANRFKTTQTSTITKNPVSGYCFDEDRDVVWLEGTGQMAVTFIKAKMENEAQSCLQEMNKNIMKSSLFPGSNALPYSANFGTSYGSDPLWEGADTQPAVSSTAWYLFGMLRFDPFEVGYSKNIPSGDKFWTK